MQFKVQICSLHLMNLEFNGFNIANPFSCKESKQFLDYLSEEELIYLSKICRIWARQPLICNMKFLSDQKMQSI